MSTGSHPADRTWGFGQGGRFAGVGGVEIQYRCFPSDDARPAVVVSSGRTEFMLKYAEVVHDLCDAGYAVYILDHRGQGFSARMADDSQVGHVERFDDYVEDLKTFVDHVVRPAQARTPGAEERPLYLLAHSMGGAIASLYLQRHADDFVAATLCSPMHQIFAPALEQTLLAALAPLCWLGRGDRYMPSGGPYGGKPFEALEDLRREALTHDRDRYETVRRLAEAHQEVRLGSPSAHWVREAILASRRVRRDAGRIATPMLLLQAGSDAIVRADGQCDFAAAAPHCRLMRIDDAYHEMLIEADTYRAPVMREILAFFGNANR